MHSAQIALYVSYHPDILPSQTTVAAGVFDR